VNKPRINHITSVGIIYSKDDPSRVFLEMKDTRYPIILFRNQLFLIGGNWIGEESKDDTSPLDTLRREVYEEFSFENSRQSMDEFNALDLIDNTGVLTPTHSRVTGGQIRPSDVAALGELREVICENPVSFGAFLNTVTHITLRRADPTHQEGEICYLACCWRISLEKEYWSLLQVLQERYGNLSNESHTVLLSLDEIITKRMQCAAGYDRVLKRFFLDMGLSRAKKLPLVKDIRSLYKGTILASYQDYLHQYDIARKPI